MSVSKSGFVSKDGGLYVIPFPEIVTDGHSLYDDNLKWGVNPNVGTGSPIVQDIWDGGGEFKGFLPAAQSVSLSSSSAEDNPAGAGIASVVVFGTGPDGYQFEFVALDGLTPVVLTKTYDSIYRMFLGAAGSGATLPTLSAGDITAVEAGLSQVMAKILQPNGQTQMATFRILSGYTGFLSQISAENQSVNSRVQLQFMACVGGVLRNFRTMTVPSDGSRVKRFPVAAELIGPMDVFVRCISSTQSALIAADWDAVLKKNN